MAIEGSLEEAASKAPVRAGWAWYSFVSGFIFALLVLWVIPPALRNWFHSPPYRSDKPAPLTKEDKESLNDLSLKAREFTLKPNGEISPRVRMQIEAVRDALTEKQGDH